MSKFEFLLFGLTHIITSSSLKHKGLALKSQDGPGKETRQALEWDSVDGGALNLKMKSFMLF